MSTANKLTYLNETKTELKTAINNKGGSLTDDSAFRNYASELDDANPCQTWGNIRQMLRDDVYIDGAGNQHSILQILPANATTTFTLNGSTLIGVKLSDGTIYTYATHGASVTHTWDTSKDLVDTDGCKYHRVIRYAATNLSWHRIPFSFHSDTIWLLFGAGVWVDDFDGTTYMLLRGIDCLGDALILDGVFNKFLYVMGAGIGKANALRYVCPLDMTKLYTYTQYQHFLETVYLDTLTLSPCIYARDFYYFPYYACKKLKLIGTGILKFTGTVYAGGNLLSVVDGVLDFSEVTSFSWFIVSLLHCYMILPNLSCSFSYCVNLDYDSLIYMCDNAPTVSAKTITLGSTLQARAGATNLAKLTAKGWTIA